MSELTETPLGPAIKTKTGEIKYPYQELKESLGGKKFETLIVFGQGPVKPVLITEELDEKQKVLWEKFKKDPLHQKEPDFRVIEPPEEPAKNGQWLDLYSSLKAVDERNDLTNEQKKAEKERIRSEWQFSGRFALNRWGRENALAAGLALYLGITDKLILSGGRTIPDWYKKKLKSDFLENFGTDSSLSPDELDKRFNLWFNTHWPSEAQLMKDIIVRRFGKMYQERYGKPIEEAIQLEDESTNTLLNFANSINKDPSLISSEGKTGFLATDFHIRRCLFLAKLFSVIEIPPENLAAEAKKLLGELDQVFSVEGPIIKAQSILKERAMRRNKETYQQIQEWFLNLDENSDLQERVSGEMRWTRGLTDPQFLEYFAQYFGEFNRPENIKPLQNFLGLLKQPNWLENARRAFKSVGLDFDEFSSENLSDLIKKMPEKFEELIVKLKRIERKYPPEN